MAPLYCSYNVTTNNDGSYYSYSYDDGDDFYDDRSTENFDDDGSTYNYATYYASTKQERDSNVKPAPVCYLEIGTRLCLPALTPYEADCLDW